jgi:hypothetical protein
MSIPLSLANGMMQAPPPLFCCKYIIIDLSNEDPGNKHSFCSVSDAPANIKVNASAFLGELLYSLNAASILLPSVIKK